MKKVGLLALNSKYIHTSLAPWCVKAGIHAHCPHPVEVRVVESTIHANLEGLAEELVGESYDLLGISCYIWNITQVETLVSLLKAKKPTLTILLGGPEVSYCPGQVLERCEADYVLSGEGELPVARLVEREFFAGEGEILGLSYRKGKEIVVNPLYTTQETPPSPYCEAYFQQLQGRIAYMESSRGCPFSCAFCLSGGEEKVRYFPMDRVKSELIALANSGTQTVKFIDRTFNSNRHHANEILTFLLEEYGKNIPTHLCFHFEMAGDILHPTTLDLLEKMPPGLVQLEVGMQSFHPPTLEAVGRKTHIPTLLANLKRLVAMDNHHLHIDLIAGLPLEDLATFGESFNIGYHLGAEMLQLGFLKVIHGSAIALDPVGYPCTHQSHPPYQVESTPWLTREDLSLLEGVEDAVDKVYNSGRFDRTLSYLFQATNWSPFALYTHLAEGLRPEVGESLEHYIDQLFQVCQNLPGVERGILRDWMVLDRVETNSTCILPQSLRVYDPQLRGLTIALEEGESTAKPPHGKRFVGILYSQNQGVYVDYPPKSKGSKHSRGRFVPHYVQGDFSSKE